MATETIMSDHHSPDKVSFFNFSISEIEGLLLRFKVVFEFWVKPLEILFVFKRSYRFFKGPFVYQMETVIEQFWDFALLEMIGIITLQFKAYFLGYSSINCIASLMRSLVCQLKYEFS